jgi:hypothetical protein
MEPPIMIKRGELTTFRKSNDMANTYYNRLRVAGAPDRLRDFINANSQYLDHFSSEPDLDHCGEDAIMQGQIGFKYASRGRNHRTVVSLAKIYPMLIFDWRFYDWMGRHAGMWLLQGETEPEGRGWFDEEVETLPWAEGMHRYPGVTIGEVAAMFYPWFGKDWRDSKEYQEDYARGMELQKVEDALTGEERAERQRAWDKEMADAEAAAGAARAALKAETGRDEFDEFLAIMAGKNKA